MKLRSGAKLVPKPSTKARGSKRGGKVAKNAPKPASPPPRSLDAEDLESCTQFNASSLLLRLPQEIKDMIYGFVIGEETIHVRPNSSAPYHCRQPEYTESFICKAVTPFDGFDGWTDEIAGLDPQEVSHAWDFAWAGRHGRCHSYDRRMTPKEIWKVPAMLLTCRQVYLEARLIVYKKFTFILDCLEYFVHWTKSLSPAQVAAVQSIQLDGYNERLSEWVPTINLMLGRLKDLRRVDLQLYQHRYGDNGELRKHIEKARQVELGSATLNVFLGPRQVATFHGTPKAGVARSIRASDLWS